MNGLWRFCVSLERKEGVSTVEYNKDNALARAKVG